MSNKSSDNFIENALAHQACVLRADLEKSQKDNASLFLKIGKQFFFCIL